MKRDSKRRTGWLGMGGILLFAVLAFSAGSHHAWADKDAEHIADGSNPNDFENRGRIDRIEGDVIVIDDMQKRLASNVKYYRPGRIRISKDAFEEGCRVGYMINPKGEISSLWLLKSGKVDKGLGRKQGDGPGHSGEKGGKYGNGG